MNLNIKYSEGFEKLGLPNYFKFGIELEAFNVKTQGKDSLYNGKSDLHVHFDSSCLTQDPKIMENFKRIYAESEELLYKMCNANNEPLRKNAINKN